jgi:hypothetical protein
VSASTPPRTRTPPARADREPSAHRRSPRDGRNAQSGESARRLRGTRASSVSTAAVRRAPATPNRVPRQSSPRSRVTSTAIPPQTLTSCSYANLPARMFDAPGRLCQVPRGNFRRADIGGVHAARTDALRRRSPGTTRSTANNHSYQRTGTCAERHLLLPAAQRGSAIRGSPRPE